jgi:dihydroorotate dehydrogenase (fumarate)
MELGDGACVGSINSEGLPNEGIDYYLDAKVVDTIVDMKKPYLVSLSGLKLKDNLEMLSRAADVPGVSAIELNLACPNVPGKPVIAYDFPQMDEVLHAVCSHRKFGVKPLGIKLAPYFDIPHFKQAADILNKYPIKFVVCTNTMGNGLVVDPETETSVIAPKGGFGGIAGGFIKYTALANVRQLSQLLRPDIDVIGAGGVRTGVDAFELILCGAKAVQVGTTHRAEGAGCFTRIANELEQIMQRKGYTSIDDFRGKLNATKLKAKL